MNKSSCYVNTPCRENKSFISNIKGYSIRSIIFMKKVHKNMEIFVKILYNDKVVVKGYLTFL